MREQLLDVIGLLSAGAAGIKRAIESSMVSKSFSWHFKIAALVNCLPSEAIQKRVAGVIFTPCIDP
jgi:hypothetical protein